MQDRLRLSEREINSDLLRSITETPMRFWVGVLILGAIIAWWVVSLVLLVYIGVETLGINRPTYWAFLITNFVFWVGISHAGTKIGRAHV